MSKPTLAEVKDLYLSDDSGEERQPVIDNAVNTIIADISQGVRESRIAQYIAAIPSGVTRAELMRELRLREFKVAEVSNGILVSGWAD